MDFGVPAFLSTAKVAVNVIWRPPGTEGSFEEEVANELCDPSFNYMGPPFPFRFISLPPSPSGENAFAFERDGSPMATRPNHRRPCALI